jgi:hypothetical protein
MRTFLGAAAGIATGSGAWIAKDSGAGIFVGALTAITIWFWAWGNIPGGRRG